jgi:mRNA interferase MazF
MNQGDIVIIPFPFTDLSDKKIRPAVIVSNKKFNQLSNVLVAAISTKPGNNDFAITLETSDLKNGELNKSSFIRLQNLFVLEKRLIIKKVAQLSAKKQKVIKEQLIDYLV